MPSPEEEDASKGAVLDPATLNFLKAQIDSSKELEKHEVAEVLTAGKETLEQAGRPPTEEELSSYYGSIIRPQLITEPQDVEEIPGAKVALWGDVEEEGDKGTRVIMTVVLEQELLNGEPWIEPLFRYDGYVSGDGVVLNGYQARAHPDSSMVWDDYADTDPRTLAAANNLVRWLHGRLVNQPAPVPAGQA